MTDIVERLREHLVHYWCGNDKSLMQEAADEIERMRVGRDTMGELWATAKESIAKLRAEIKEYEGLMREATERLLTSDCENERLRAALEEVGREANTFPYDIDRVRSILQAALAPTPAPHAPQPPYDRRVNPQLEYIRSDELAALRAENERLRLVVENGKHWEAEHLREIERLREVIKKKNSTSS